MFISLSDLLIGLALFFTFCLIVTVAIIFIVTLMNVNKVVKKADRLLDSNTENINKTLGALPDTVKNVNEVAISLKQNVDKAGNVIDTIDEAVVGTVVSVSEGTESIFDIVKIIGNVAKVVSGIFSKKDED